MKTLRSIIALMLIAVLTAVSATGALALGDTLRWGINASTGGQFLSGVATSLYDQYVMQLTGDPLVYLDESSETESYFYRLADSFEISDDMLTYTFHLNEKAAWSDGEPFTAEDVVFDFTTQCDGRFAASSYTSYWSHIVGASDYHAYTEALASGTADGMTPVESISGLQIIDEHTVSITLNGIFAPFMSSGINGFILYPKHIWENIPIETWRTCEQLANPIGTGAYILQEYVPGQYLTFTANENYYLGCPKIPNFVYKIINEDTAQVEIINGDLDVISMVSTTSDEALGTYTDNGIVVTEFAYTGYVSMIFNTETEKLGNAYIRQGLTTAINRQGIADSILNGHATVLDVPIYYDSWAYPDDLNHYSYDPAKALELLAQGGVSDTDGDGKLDMNGEQFTLSLICPTGNKAREQAAVVIQQNFASIGIECSIETMEFNSMAERVIYDTDFELSLIGMTTGLDPNAVYAMFCTANAAVNGNANFSNWGTEELDALMIAGAATTDSASRTETYYQVAHILNDNMPECWLYSPNQIRVSRP